MFYDVRYIRSRSLKISIENGRVERTVFDRSEGKAFRVLKNGFWGFFTGNVSDSEGLRLAEKNAVGFGSSDVYELEKRSESYILKPKENPEDISIEEKIRFLKDVEKELKDRHVVSTSITYFESHKEFYYYDSFGVEVYYKVPRIGIVIQGVARDKTLQFYSKRIMKPSGFEALKDCFEIAQEVRDVLKGLVNAKTPPSGRMNVVIDPGLGGVFIHEAFGHAVEGDHVLQGSSVLADKIGKRVANENVNICDNPTIKEFGFFPFDDEGVKAEKRVIIKNGVLVDFLNSRETAKKLNSRPGNARADGLEFPLVRMSNTYLEEGDMKFEELIEEAKNGVYLIGSRGGETNPATGYFQFNAQYGYIIKNGEIYNMIRDVSLSGNTLDVLKDIRIGSGLRFDPGFCGKNGQLVPVSDGSPYALIKAVVGGSI